MKKKPCSNIFGLNGDWKSSMDGAKITVALINYTFSDSSGRKLQHGPMLAELHNVNLFTQIKTWVQNLPQKRVNRD